MHVLAENSIPLPQDKTARMNIKNNNNNVTAAMSYKFIMTKVCLPDVQYPRGVRA